MNIPDEYAIPGIGMLATLVSGLSVWFVNQNKQNIDNIKKDIKEIKEQVDLHDIAIHEDQVRRQSDVDIMTNLTRNMEALSEKITQLRIELQNKQPRV